MKVKVIKAIDKPDGLQNILQKFLDNEKPQKICWISQSAQTINELKDHTVNIVLIIFYE